MSLDSLLDTSKEVFSMDKDIIVFNIKSNNIKASSSPIALTESDISIKNLTNDYLAFRTKTTKKSLYAVNPTYYIIPPNEVRIIKIILYNVPGEKMVTKGHKFRFEGFIINENEKDKDVKELFIEYQNKGDKIIGNIHKRNVQFIYEDENENGEDKKDTTDDSKLEHLQKEEIKTKEQNNLNEKLNDENDTDKLNTKKSEKINSNKNQYLVIGVVIFSISLLLVSFYLFK